MFVCLNTEVPGAGTDSGLVFVSEGLKFVLLYNNTYNMCKCNFYIHSYVHIIFILSKFFPTVQINVLLYAM